jgi:diacylglycerol kinase family enzyme
VIPVLLNPSAGRAEEVRSALCDAGCFDVRPVEGSEVTQAAQEALAEGARRVAVAGGDGTISSAAAALAGSGAELIVIPAGTLNHFARDHGIPSDISAACGLAKSRTVKEVDVALVNGRLFLNMSSVGTYATFVRLREKVEPFLGYWLASLVAAARTLIRAKPFALRVETELSRRDYHTRIVFIGVGERDVSITAAGERLKNGRSALHLLVLRGWRLRFDRAFVTRCLIEQRHSTVAVDGEVVHLDSPLRYVFWPKALRVVVPSSTI